MIERGRVDAAERLVAEVGDPGVDLEILQEIENLDRCARIDRELHIGVTLPVRRCQRRHHRQRGWDGGDAQPPAKAVPERVDLLSHRPGVADDAACPVEYPLSLRSESLETRAPIDQQHAHLPLELLDPCRQRRLGNAAGFRRSAEMPRPGQRQDELELVQHRSKSPCAQLLIRMMQQYISMAPKSIGNIYQPMDIKALCGLLEGFNSVDRM